MVAEFHERAVKALDVCNAARDGVDQVRRWERLAEIAASVLRGPAEIHEGQLRRARKALSDLSGLLVDDTAASGSGGVASFLASHRNRSFGRARASPSRSAVAGATTSASSSHFRSLSWSVSRTWSAARQLQAIGAGLAAPRAHEAGLAAPVYSMGCVLHLAAWALVAAVPCPDRGTALQVLRMCAAGLPLLLLRRRLATVISLEAAAVEDGEPGRPWSTLLSRRGQRKRLQSARAQSRGRRPPAAFCCRWWQNPICLGCWR